MQPPPSHRHPTSKDYIHNQSTRRVASCPLRSNAVQIYWSHQRDHFFGFFNSFCVLPPVVRGSSLAMTRPATPAARFAGTPPKTFPLGPSCLPSPQLLSLVVVLGARYGDIRCWYCCCGTPCWHPIAIPFLLLLSDATTLVVRRRSWLWAKGPLRQARGGARSWS